MALSISLEVVLPPKKEGDKNKYTGICVLTTQNDGTRLGYLDKAWFADRYAGCPSLDEWLLAYYAMPIKSRVLIGYVSGVIKDVPLRACVEFVDFLGAIGLQNFDAVNRDDNENFIIAGNAINTDSVYNCVRHHGYNYGCRDKYLNTIAPAYVMRVKEKPTFPEAIKTLYEIHHVLKHKEQAPDVSSEPGILFR